MKFPILDSYMHRLQSLFFCLILLFSHAQSARSQAFQKQKTLLDKGWAELVRDNDSLALLYFGQSFEAAFAANDYTGMGDALLNSGLCNYSVSTTDGMDYAMRAMGYYKKAENTEPEKAKQGRARCLQLIGTIYARQGKYREAINTSKSAIPGLDTKGDTTGTLGLIYQLFGTAYRYLQMPDSASFFIYKALEETELTKNYVYLPGALTAVAEIELKTSPFNSLQYINRALLISDSTANRQAKVNSLLMLHKWNVANSSNVNDSVLQEAYRISKTLRAKSYKLKTILAFADYTYAKGQYREATDWLKVSQAIKDSINNWEKIRLQNSLEAKFRLKEFERNLDIVQKENRIKTLNNYLLTGILFFTLILSAIIIRLQMLNVKRKKQLVQAKEALLVSLSEQKRIRENQLNNELEFHQDQLHAMGLQVKQKQELMQELMEVLENDERISNNPALKKLLQKGQFQENDWRDFNSWFESANKNFYQRLKSAYPEISPNDLRLCALIRLNLSSKEMARILNITPESVKTARYRLRKKLSLNSEDNLTEFILSL